MRKFKIILVELGMLLGIGLSAFLLPRSTPLLLFGIASLAVFITGNVLLLRGTAPTAATGFQSLSSRRRRNLILIVILWGTYFLMIGLLHHR